MGNATSCTAQLSVATDTDCRGWNKSPQQNSTACLVVREWSCLVKSALSNQLLSCPAAASFLILLGACYFVLSAPLAHACFPHS